MAEGRDFRLTAALMSRLAEAIPLEKLESIATRYLGIETAAIDNLKMKHRTNVEAISRAILEQWRNKYLGPTPVKVRITRQWVRPEGLFLLVSL